MATENEIVYATDINGAYMVPVGRTVSNSLQLLVSPHFKELLNSLARKMDYVIVDAPPLGLLIDAAEIAKSCDGALIVVGYDSVHRQAAARREGAAGTDGLSCSRRGAEWGSVGMIT